jgi:hypothetical protein
MDGRQSACLCVCLSVYLSGWLVFLLCVSSCLEAILDRTEDENSSTWFTIRKWEYFMNILKILKYATCLVTVRLETNQSDISRCSICTLLTFDPLVVCKLSFVHTQTNVQTED